jgi:MoaA/NifB/PqqE/SkfB family radical SAM enzyme
MSSETFCILPWIHLFVSTTGTLRPCCISQEFSNRHKIFEEGIDNFFNSEDMKALRLALLNNDRPSVCTTCWDKERLGDSYSKRKGELSLWKSKINIDELINNTSEDGTIPVNVFSYDLRLGNLCNLKCVMCTPNSSSKWLEDKSILNKYENTHFNNNSLKNHKWPSNDELWDHLEKNYENIQIIQFAGGEPLLHKKHYRLLSQLVEGGYSKNIFLKYNTNITVLPPEVFELWSKFQRVDIWSSIDGISELNDYIRYPSRWSNILDSLSTLDNTPDNMNIRINATLSALNVEYLPELYNFIVNQKYKKIGKGNWYDGTHISPDLVYNPLHLSIRILPKHIKERVTKKLLAHIEEVENTQYKEQVNFVINYMNEEDWHDQHYSVFLKYVDELDTIRKFKYPYDIYRPN